MPLTSGLRDIVATYKGMLLAYLSIHTAAPGMQVPYLTVMWVRVANSDEVVVRKAGPIKLL